MSNGMHARSVHGASAELLRRAHEAQSYLEGWQRARADYENLSRRSAAERENARKEGAQQTLLSLLRVIDHFDAAFAAVPQDIALHPWVDGMRHIRSAFAAALEAEGIQPISETRIPFDPTRHEAVENVSDDTPVGTVLDVISHGYIHGGTVLRPAKVRVSTGTQ